MIQNKKILAVIPARGGSKGIKRKNIKKMKNKPLIGWTIEAAKKSKYIDRLILSSEDAEIMKVARSLGCEVPFRRPSQLSTDRASGVSPALHAIAELPGYDYVVLLQPTSPLRTTKDIDAAIEFCFKTKAPACVSLSEAKSPAWHYSLGGGGRLKPLMKTSEHTRRQDLPVYYCLNGAIFIAAISWLKKKKTFLTPETVGFVMPAVRALDIDTPKDFSLAEAILEKGLHR